MKEDKGEAWRLKIGGLSAFLSIPFVLLKKKKHFKNVTCKRNKKKSNFLIIQKLMTRRAFFTLFRGLISLCRGDFKMFSTNYITL